MNNKKPLFIIILLIIIFYVINLGLPQNVKQEKIHFDDIPQRIIEVTNYDKSKLNSIEIKINTESTKYILNKNNKTWYIENNLNLNLNNDDINTIGDLMSNFQTFTKIKSNNLKQYGLENPISTVTIFYDDGNYVTYFLGNKTNDGNLRYIQVKGDSSIYLVNELVGSKMCMNLKDFIN